MYETKSESDRTVRTLAAYDVSSVAQSLSRVRLFATPWTAARQASLSITISQSLLKLMSIESVMPSNHLILCRPLLLTPSILPSIRVLPVTWRFTNYDKCNSGGGGCVSCEPL